MENCVKKKCDSCNHQYFAVSNKDSKCPKCKLHNTETIKEEPKKVTAV